MVNLNVTRLPALGGFFRAVGGAAALCLAAAPAVEAAQDHPLDWMAGCWRSESGRFQEVWTGALTHLFGYGLVIRDGEVAAFEQMRIEPGEAGYVFNAYPSGVGPTRFEEAERGDQTITFLNADHDYPQRIIYGRAGDTMTARISLANGEELREWVYQPCPASAD